jgi:uncharacterized DUF497 family protein
VDDPWDPVKAAANLRKHGVGFPEAMTVADDRNVWRLEDDEHSSSEERFVLIGRSEAGRVLTVVCTVRGGDTRPISARRATKRERHEYWFRC